MHRVNTRGIELSNKHVLMAALAYNLKKYLKYFRKDSIANAATIPVYSGYCFLLFLIFNLLSDDYYLFFVKVSNPHSITKNLVKY